MFLFYNSIIYSIKFEYFFFVDRNEASFAGLSGYHTIIQEGLSGHSRNRAQKPEKQAQQNPQVLPAIRCLRSLIWGEDYYQQQPYAVTEQS